MRLRGSPAIFSTPTDSICEIVPYRETDPRHLNRYAVKRLGVANDEDDRD
ncbi:MAG TPA: hypothetical protein VN974_01340 [Candidatus Dormibacteraeota bacterium]|nr:hypothetical protein [Candidatus Dormibacteraeota bacterium]